MADIDKVADTIRIANAFLKSSIMEELERNSEALSMMNREQLYCGQKIDGTPITPTYLDDPYFKQKKNADGSERSDAQAKRVAMNYRGWKLRITPPLKSSWLGLNPRSIDTPNLVITGKFHNSIRPKFSEDSIEMISTESTLGGAIISKFGKDILGFGNPAKEYMVDKIVTPYIRKFFKGLGL